MPIPQIVQTAQGTSVAVNVTTISATFASKPAEGNLLLCFVIGGTINSTQIWFSSTSNTFSTPNGISQLCNTAYSFAGSNEAQTITAAYIGTATTMTIFIMEISGVDRLNPFDTSVAYTAVNTNNTTRSLLATVNVRQANRVNQLWLTALMLGGAGSGSITYKFDHLQPTFVSPEYSVNPGGTVRSISIGVRPLDVGYEANTPLPVNGTGVGIVWSWVTNRPTTQIFVPINAAPPADGMIQTSGL